MYKELVIGIDPGKSGGIAMINRGSVTVYKMPGTERDLWEVFKSTDGWYEKRFAYIEKVGAMPGQGVTSMFSFGQNYGMLRAFLIASEIRFETITPRKWQKEFGLVFPKSMGLSKTEKKNRHKARAQELFPLVEMTHAVADALLIAEFGNRLRSKVT